MSQRAGRPDRPQPPGVPVVAVRGPRPPLLRVGAVDYAEGDIVRLPPPQAGVGRIVGLYDGGVVPRVLVAAVGTVEVPAARVELLNSQGEATGLFYAYVLRDLQLVTPEPVPMVVASAPTARPRARKATGAV